MEERKGYLKEIEEHFKVHKVVALLGPRQCGKTTLARLFCKQRSSFLASNYFDLENPIDLERLSNPLLALKPLSGLIVIDEIQRHPELFPILRFLVDDSDLKQQYLILGSASRELIKQSSESLAGRISYLELTPFTYKEVDHIETLWIRGGFPRSYLAKNDQESFEWRSSYTRTFLEQDVPNLGFKIAPVALRRFWIMLAHYHGNIFNASELGRSFGASNQTMRNYLDLLTGTFMIRQLLPWHQNISKRQVKSPKIFFRDSGIFHALLNIHNFQELLTNPKIGASWEGFALEEVIRASRIRSEECFFWSTYAEAEMDLLIPDAGGFRGFEFKYTDAPKMTKSMQMALQDLNLKQIDVIYPGDKDYQLAERVFVRGLKNFLDQA
jgi:predicted AAA+ superfamily ATPase